MFRRKKGVGLVPDAEAKKALERLEVLTDRLEESTLLLADLVVEMQEEEQGADRDAERQT